VLAENALYGDSIWMYLVQHLFDSTLDRQQSTAQLQISRSTNHTSTHERELTTG
jgi:hypothetical protein